VGCGVAAVGVLDSQQREREVVGVEKVLLLGEMTVVGLLRRGRPSDRRWRGEQQQPGRSCLHGRPAPGDGPAAPKR
ncbi:hypothetical protein KBZ21_41135, partial [Streptomyces sp. A73]|nr:hypothetical protein [Streptomyces sp. A73]